jgi:hypothetical protein
VIVVAGCFTFPLTSPSLYMHSWTDSIWMLC